MTQVVNKNVDFSPDELVDLSKVAGHAVAHFCPKLSIDKLEGISLITCDAKTGASSRSFTMLLNVNPGMFIKHIIQVNGNLAMLKKQLKEIKLSNSDGGNPFKFSRCVDGGDMDFMKIRNGYYRAKIALSFNPIVEDGNANAIFQFITGNEENVIPEDDTPTVAAPIAPEAPKEYGMGW